MVHKIFIIFIHILFDNSLICWVSFRCASTGSVWPILSVLDAECRMWWVRVSPPCLHVSMSPAGAPVTPSGLRHKCVCTSFLTGPESCLTLAAWGPAGLSNTQLRIMVTTHVTKYTRTSCQSVLQWYMPSWPTCSQWSVSRYPVSEGRPAGCWGWYSAETASWEKDLSSFFFVTSWGQLKWKEDPQSCNTIGKSKIVENMGETCVI